MPAKIIYKKEEFIIPHGLTIQAAIELLEIPPETVVPAMRGELVPDEKIIQAGEIIRLVSIISGG